MSYNFFVKGNITFGKGAVKELPRILNSYKMKKIMIVYDYGVKMAGISEKILRVLKETNVETVIFDKVIPNPTNEIVEEGALLAKNENVEGFVAVGGGSSIDLAKAINVLMTNPGTISEYGGVGMVKNDVYPLIAVPTTAGTSSEITNVSALIDTEKTIKYVVIDNKITPSDVIADPEFTKTMPASVTAATGMDAITHAVESYISNRATPLTEYNSLKGLELIYNNIEKVIENGADMDAREAMMLGCIITGFGFSNADLGMVHAIAHTLSAHFHLAHGMANATVLPYVMDFNAQACPEKMRDLAKVMGLEISGDIDKDKYLVARELLRLTKALNIQTLSQQGIKKQDFDMLADDVLNEPVLGFNPRQNVTKEQVICILEKAF
ncbi:MAG: iron-containing alcohol dehydrogenase family protein [Suipraeoptans sp.]